MPHVAKGAFDATVAPAAILPSEPNDSSLIFFMRPGRPTRLLGYVHLIAISRQCHRKIVSGVTIVATCIRSRRPIRFPFAAKRRR